jgi:SpoIID/LytB domain protein
MKKMKNESQLTGMPSSSLRKDNEAQVSVGIMSDKQIEVVFKGRYECNNGRTYNNKQRLRISRGSIVLESVPNTYYTELLFTPQDADASFELQDVSIGIDFHWEQKENQRFSGSLKIITEEKASNQLSLTAINILPVEDYLTSVISSEMSATASLELLKAHAVISRSWLLANIVESGKLRVENGERRTEIGKLKDESEALANSPLSIFNSQLIKYYERDAHQHFDVCADDHCQRYQGITRASTPQVQQAIAETRGQVLMYEGAICDARFSKSCGGITERFSACWADVDYEYLSPVRDNEECRMKNEELANAKHNVELNTDEGQNSLLSSNSSFLSLHSSFCNTSDKKILAQVLNNYDQSTTDFYRWTVRYTQQELQDIIYSRHPEFDLGDITDLIPVKRGASGRIILLKIVGTKAEITIGKELEIRKTLSRTHLYSSAFEVEREGGDFILNGAGWGHGVGLCQIGAAVMGEKGYNYRQILAHYYKGAEIEELY